MKTAAVTIALIGTLAAPAFAQSPYDRARGTAPVTTAISGAIRAGADWDLQIRVQRGPGPDWRRDGPRGRAWGSNVGYDVGYRDGLDKGRDDARDRDRYDPTRHGRYRSADHRYEREYGPKEFYRDAYRQGFLQGYREGYGANNRGRHRW